MDESQEKQQEKNKWIGIVTTLVIVVLILGYLPLSNFLFKKHFTIDYQTIIGSQYDTPGEKDTQAKAVDLVRTDENGSIMISGLELSKRYTELTLDTQGVKPKDLQVTAEYSGDPDQLWMHVGGLYEESAYSWLLDLPQLNQGDWNVLQDGDVSLYQQGDRFNSLDDLYAYTTTSSEDIGLAGIKPGEVLAKSMAGVKSPARELLDMPIRGHQDLELLVTGGSLHIEISKLDLNRAAGSDEVSVTVEKDGLKLYDGSIPDDGDVLEDYAMSSQEQRSIVDLNGIEDGLYDLNITPLFAGDDFVMTGIISDAAKAVFKDKVFLFDPRETAPAPIVPAVGSATLYLDSIEGVLSCQTWNPILARSVSLGSQKLLGFKVKGPDAPLQSGSVKLGEGTKELRLENPGSLILNFPGGGFSFSVDDVFDPNFPHLPAVINFPTQDFPLILTNGYQPPAQEGAFKVSSKTIPVAGTSFPGEKIKIVLENLGGKDVVLTSLSIRLEGK